MTITMKPISELYMKAHEELLFPYPSIKLPDYHYFNEVTGGLRSNEFTILCGPTGSGKTQFCSNLSTQLLLAGVPHFVASVETGHTDYIKRVMSALCREDLNTGDPIPLEKLKEINRDYANLLNSKGLILSLMDNRIPIENLIADLEEAKEQRGCKIAIIDNLSFLLEVVSAQNQIVEMDRVIHELIIFCKRTDIHILMVMHPKKTEGGRVESEFDIKGSSTAVQEAHNVVLFNRPTKEDHKAGFSQSEYRELKFVKLRRRGKYVYRKIFYRNLGGYYAEDRLV